MLRFFTAGETHGPAVGVVVDGLPAGVPVERAAIDGDLRRRQGGYGRGGRMQIETDTVEILGGVRHGLTLGSPVNLLVRNRDHENWRDVMSASEKSDSAIAKIVNNGLVRLQSSRKREDIDASMEEGMMEIVPRLEKRTHYIATFANVITLVGLLGTIIGLIKGFTAVAQVNPAEKAELLSASISIAMNNTAFALMVAIPFLLIHAFLQARATEIVDSLEAAKVSFLNLAQRMNAEVRRGAAE